MTPIRLQKSVAWLVTVASLAALAWNSWRVLQAPISGDAILYFGMGRGLLNDLHLWTDLFETKPPIVFWLSALSLRLTGGAFLYHACLLSGIWGTVVLLAKMVRPSPLG